MSYQAAAQLEALWITSQLSKTLTVRITSSKVFDPEVTDRERKIGDKNPEDSTVYLYFSEQMLCKYGSIDSYDHLSPATKIWFPLKTELCNAQDKLLKVKAEKLTKR